MNKTIDSIRFENRQNRRSMSLYDGPMPEWYDIADSQPTPDMMAAASDSLECLLARLDQTLDTENLP